MRSKGFILDKVLLVLVLLAVIGGGVIVTRQKQNQSASPEISVLPTPSPSITFTTSTPTSVPTPTASTNVSNPGRFDGDLRTLPTAPPVPSPAVFTDKSSSIAVTLSKESYNKGEEIAVQITNNSQQAFSFFLCPDVVGWEKKSGEIWEQAEICSNCGSAAPCVQTTLNSGQNLGRKITISTQAQSGTYRAIFHYLNGTSYSSQFTIF
ncbi:MAG: hypothetical protein Q7S44_00690 [bacterium]|nr:hypothetical protein [bacterium]